MNAKNAKNAMIAKNKLRLGIWDSGFFGFEILAFMAILAFLAFLQRARPMPN
jgi:hypothetical protein